MLYLHWDLGLFPRQDIEMLRLFLTDVTISLLFLLLEQNLDPSSPTHVDFVGSIRGVEPPSVAPKGLKPLSCWASPHQPFWPGHGRGERAGLSQDRKGVAETTEAVSGRTALTPRP